MISKNARYWIWITLALGYNTDKINKLYELTERDDCDFVLWIGSRRLIKRKQLEEFIERTFSL